MNRFAFASLAVLLLVSAGANGATPDYPVYSGTYVLGAKGDRFTLCDGKGPFLTRVSKAVKEPLLEFYRTNVQTTDQPIYISFRGLDLDEIVETKGKGMFQITDLLVMSISAPATCGNAAKLGLPIRKDEAFQGKKLIFVVQEIQSSEPNAGSGKPYTDRTGIFYYCKESGPGECERNSLVGDKLRNGKVIGVGGDNALLEDLKALPLTSFDVQAEIDSTLARLRVEAAKNHTGVPNWATKDGAKYRILYDFNGVYIDYTAWNPSVGIKILAAYSPNLKYLNDLLDRIALDYGRSQLW